MVESARIRWGILGTAGIAESAFLPALRRTGDGDAVVVGSRDGTRAERWASAQGVGRGVEGYERVIADPQVDAVYIPLPNGLHAEWTIAALAAGKAVLCEKPLCASPQETDATLTAARGAAGPLWEAFVFPFHDQIEHAQAVIAGGEIGEVREIWSRFHFPLDEPDDIRLFAELAGGSIQDVGCYPIRLARLLFDGEPEPSRTLGDAVWIGTNVDSELWGTLTFAGDRRLMLSCGFRSREDTFTRVLGTEGEIRMTNPFHPGPGDSMTILRGDEAAVGPAAPAGEPSFIPALRHIHRVLQGTEAPRHLAVDEAMGNAVAIAELLRVART